MLLSEFRVKQLKICTPDLSGYILAKLGVVPNDVDGHNKCISHKTQDRAVQILQLQSKNGMPYEWKLSQRIGCLPSNRLTEHHNPPESYVDRTENSLKTRHSNHKSSFSTASKCHNTELGKYIWYLKENLTKFKVKWRILQHTCLLYTSPSPRDAQ